MSEELFTEKDFATLSKNRYVKIVSSKGITYTDEFKQHFITENSVGKFPREIFEEAGFNVDVIGMKRVKSASDRWKAAYKAEGCWALKIPERTVRVGRELKNCL
ncbi:hypothetical protein D3C76_1074350 [compost metagenome]